MSGKRSKLLRKAIYGDHSNRVRTYDRQAVLTNVDKYRIWSPFVLCNKKGSLRNLYQEAKEAYKAKKI